MAKYKGPNYVITMRLYPEQWQEDILSKTFRETRKIHNDLIRHELKKYNCVKRAKDYRETEAKIKDMLHQRKNAAWNERQIIEDALKSLYTEKKNILKSAEISDFDFRTDCMRMAKPYSKYICAKAAIREGSTVWAAFDKVIWGNGKFVHMKKYDDFTSIGLLDNDMKIDGYTLTWSGGLTKGADGKKHLPRKVAIRMQRPETEYEIKAFQDYYSSCKITRKWMKNKYHYYVQVTMRGVPPERERKIGTGKRVGIDIGTSSIAAVGEDKEILLPLSGSNKKTVQKEIALLRKIDRSRRANNPDNFLPDGTVKSGKRLTWNNSKRYIKLRGRLRELRRKEADKRKYNHIALANEIIGMGTKVYVETMNFRGLQHRVKKTTINKKTNLPNRKKRFGKSLGKNAPSMLIGIIDNKLKAKTGEGIHKIDTFSFKASQYDHTNDSFKKKTLDERVANLSNGDSVQRDLYSAFLIMNTNESLTEPIQAACAESYSRFKAMHDILVKNIAHTWKHIPQTFGIQELVNKL